MDPRTAKMLEEHRAAAASAPPPPTGVAKLVKDLRTWAKANPLPARVAAGAAIVIFLIGYYFVIAVPMQQREYEEEQAHTLARLKVEAAARQTALDTCLSNAKTDTDDRWNKQCKVRRMKDGCALPSHLAELLERGEKQARNACLIQVTPAGQ
jgi:hypothetical protein